MPSVTYYVVVPFHRDDAGMVAPGEGAETPNGEVARRRVAAVATAPANVSAVPFSRTGDTSTGVFADGVILASFGEVDLDALQG